MALSLSLWPAAVTHGPLTELEGQGLLGASSQRCQELTVGYGFAVFHCVSPNDFHDYRPQRDWSVFLRAFAQGHCLEGSLLCCCQAFCVCLLPPGPPSCSLCARSEQFGCLVCPSEAGLWNRHRLALKEGRGGAGLRSWRDCLVPFPTPLRG